MIDTSSIASFLSFSASNNDNFITDQYASSVFNIEGGTSVSIIGNIWTMTQDEYLLNNNFEYPTNFDMSIGFWIKPINDGLIKSQTSEELINFNKSILGFEVLDDNFNTSPIISVYEQVTANGNRIFIKLYGSGEASLIYSSLYTENIWHYIWIEFIDITTGNIKIYLDGVEDNITKISNTYPNSFGSLSYCHYTLNHILYDIYGDVRNNASIYDILVLNGQLSNLSVDLQSLINVGLSGSLQGEPIINNFSLLYNDESTKSINTIMSQKSNYLIGTNYGKVYESILSLWDVYNNFSDIDETLIKSICSLSDNISYTIENGFFVLENGSLQGL